MSDVGFVILAHAAPLQTERLVMRLNRSFDRPLIVCHDGGSYESLGSHASANVVYVRPSVATEWGTFSLVDALLASLRTFRAHRSAPEWMVFLSGSDYPIERGGQIVDELVGGGYDAYLSHELIDPRHLRRPWHELCWQRYCGLQIQMPFRAAGRWKARRITVRSRHARLLDAPYSNRFPCYAGEFWFSANRNAIDALLAEGVRQRALAARLRSRPIPEETYVNTVLANAAGLRLSADCKRYVDWSANTGAHPKTLTIEDLPRLVGSTAHFARKFDSDVDSDVLDEIDQLL